MLAPTSSMFQQGLIRQVADPEGGDEKRLDKVQMNRPIKNWRRNISGYHCKLTSRID